jgi:hypothetical protein
LLFYNPAGVEQAVGPMRFVRTSFDRNEGRQDRRYPVPPIVVAIDGVEYSTVNWSLGGFLITGFDRRISPGKPIAGTLGTPEQPVMIEFSAKVVRVGEPVPGQLAVQFTDLGEHGLSVLERILTRRMFRG